MNPTIFWPSKHVGITRTLYASREFEHMCLLEPIWYNFLQAATIMKRSAPSFIMGLITLDNRDGL